MYILSPDTDDILLAISIVNGGASVLPEDLDAAVSHSISKLGADAIRLCANTDDKYKRGFLIGWAERMRNENTGNPDNMDEMGAHSASLCLGKGENFRRGFFLGYSQCKQGN